MRSATDSVASTSCSSGPLADVIAAAKGPKLQDVLATLSVVAAGNLPLLRKEIDVAQLQSEISEQVNAQNAGAAARILRSKEGGPVKTTSIRLGTA